MKNVIETAKARIARFCEVNHIALNEELLNVPVYEIKEFFVGRDQSEGNFTEEEARYDLGDSEAYCLLDDLTSKPVILYDTKHMEAYGDFEDKVQVIIHEFMHYKEVIEGALEDDSEQDPAPCGGLLPTEEQELEAIAEALSYVITCYPEIDLNEGFDQLSLTIDIEALLTAYEDVDIGRKILRKIFTMTREDIQMVLE